MHIDFEIESTGVAIIVDGAAVQIAYPEAVWAAFPAKKSFAGELAFLTTYTLPSVSADSVVTYGFGRPRFEDTYDKWYGDARQYLRQAHDPVERRFTGDTLRSWPTSAADPSRAVVSVTMGKDSLATVVLARAMGLHVSAAQACQPNGQGCRLRVERMTEMCRSLGVDALFVDDGVRGLASAIVPAAHSTGIMWSLGIAAYALMMVPFCHYARARHLLIGSEYEHNYPVCPEVGEKPVVLSPLQSIAGTAELDLWMDALTGGCVRVASLVQPLHRLAEHALVHRVCPEVGAHQVSCRRATDEHRWCHTCRTCAESFLFATAVSSGNARIGFERALTDETDGRHYDLVTNGLDETEPYRYHLARQELLALFAVDPDAWLPQYARARYPGELGNRAGLADAYLRPVDQAWRDPLVAHAAQVAGELIDPVRRELGSDRGR